MAKISQIIIGDEILSGKIQDLNINWLATHLLPTAHSLVSSTIVGDNEDEIIGALEDNIDKNDIIIVTGGLGPTLDDKTKHVLAKFLDAKLQENPWAKDYIIKQYEKFGKKWTPETNDYHMIPEGVTPLYNPQGIAPGLQAKVERTLILCAPGVPKEFQAMTEEIFMPIIDKEFPQQGKKIEFFNIRSYGIPEEVIFSELCPNLWQDLEKFGSVSSLPQISGVDITLRLAIDEDLEQKKKSIKELINSSAIADSVWQFGMKSLPEYIVDQAKEKNIKISFAESCTGGLTASMITDIAGSSQVFNGSIVAYANEVKINALKVKKETLDEFGAVSEQTALEMAIGARDLTESDIAISFTGIAGPGGGSEYKPVGTVGIGWSYRKNNEVISESKIYHFRGDRVKLKTRFAMKGLIKLLKIIESL